MKAVRIHASGNAKELKLEEVQPPKVLADDELLVRIRDAGVNSFDLTPATVPHTAGRDFAGQVMEIGEAVKDFAIGDRVFGFADGSYTEFAAIPVRMLAHMPKSTDFDEAAALPTPALTAYQIVMHEVMAEAGDRLFVRGARTVTGGFVVQLARWKGAQVLEHPGDEMDAIIDVVGGSVDGLPEMVRKGGILVSNCAMRPNGAQLAVVARLVDAGVLQPRLGRVLPLADAGLALELLHTQGARGKIVLSVSHP
ncbi:MAG TPA: NADP-dependent oxidoreductase [Burkholderiales bacterium]|jgi:NADPH:quinone reductase-like Zn-dependent oxidoreductase|nr:NADP-dependent oxidoreductase [Burkholderiales bacterium]